MLVEDIFTVTGRGTVFLGNVQSGSVSIGDQVVCKTPQTEVYTRVIAVEDPRSGRRLDRGEPGSTIAVVCKTIDHKSLVGAWQGEGGSARVVGVTLSLGSKKGWWPFQ